MKEHSQLLHKIRASLRPRNSFFHPSHNSYKWILLANIMMGTFMAVLDSTIVNVGLPKIMASFGVGIDKVEWVITSYMLALAVMLPTSGWLADKFGYKSIYFTGLALFTFGSLLCGMSGNETTLVLSRIVQGLGGGMIQPLGMAIITREFPPEKRGIAIGFWAVSAAASVSFGPLIGGYLVDNYSWQFIFDINVPVGIVALLATFIIQEEYKSKDVKKFDLVGFISVTLFFPLMIYALSEGNAVTNTEGWKATHILVAISISLISLIVFITTELTVENPLIDLRLMGERNFGLSNITMLLFGIGVFGGVFLLPLYLQNALGYTALQSGAVFLPVGIIQGVIAPLTGIVADRTNPKIPIIIGTLLLVASFTILSRLSFLTELQYVMISLYLRGLSMGMIFTSLSAVSLFNIPKNKMAQASSVLNTLRQLGGSLGVAIMTTILTSRITYHTQIYGEALQANSQPFRNTVSHLGNYIQLHLGVTHASASKLGEQVLVSHVKTQGYIEGINDVFLVAAIIMLVELVPVIFLQVKRKP